MPIRRPCRHCPVYTGPFGPEQAERLLWRAGFGPRSGEAQHLAAKGLHGAVDSLVHPPAVDRLVGKPPVVDGARRSRRRTRSATTTSGGSTRWCAPRGRSSSGWRSIWHDWFATSNETVGSQKLMLQQNELFRQIGLGSFEGLAMRVTINPAMLRLPQRPELAEGLAERELRPGADGAVHPRRRQRLHRARRPRAGARPHGLDGRLPQRPRLGALPLQAREPRRRDEGDLREGRRRSTGRAPWSSAIEHPKHPAYFVNKLWSYFIPVPPDDADRDAARAGCT